MVCLSNYGLLRLLGGVYFTDESLFGVIFFEALTVGTPVTRRPPHRSVREDFPHTVPWSPLALCQWRTQQATPRWAHNFAILQFYPDAKCCGLF